MSNATSQDSAARHSATLSSHQNRDASPQGSPNYLPPDESHRDNPSVTDCAVGADARMGVVRRNRRLAVRTGQVAGRTGQVVVRTGQVVVRTDQVAGRTGQVAGLVDLGAVRSHLVDRMTAAVVDPDRRTHLEAVVIRTCYVVGRIVTVEYRSHCQMHPDGWAFAGRTETVRTLIKISLCTSAGCGRSSERDMCRLHRPRLSYQTFIELVHTLLL